jgi:hypothetical protein
MKDNKRIIQKMDKAPNKWESAGDKAQLLFGWAWVALFGLVGAVVILLAVFGDGK